MPEARRLYEATADIRPTHAVGRVTMDLRAHYDHFSRFGGAGYLTYLSYRLGSYLVNLQALRGMTLTMETVNPEYLDLRGYGGRRVRGTEIFALVGKDLGISREFAEQAVRRGDWCYLIDDRGKPISHGWYTTKTSPIKGGISLEFSMLYLYMYNGFTRPEYRGRRLHAFGMAQGLRIAHGDGYRGLISFVDADNAASLRSIERLGYKIFGNCYIARLFSHYFIYSTAGCTPFDFRVVRSPSAADGDPH